jgi:hypothetical protein
VLVSVYVFENAAQELEAANVAAAKKTFAAFQSVDAVLFDMDGVLADVTHSQHKVRYR